MPMRGFLDSLVLGGALGVFAGCSCEPEQPASAALEAMLTPERAKQALLGMMQSKPGKDLGWFDGNIVAEMSKMRIEEQENGWYGWTPAFRFNTSEAIYTFVVRPRPGARACVFEYKGAFVIKDGRWGATPPELVRTALQAGE